VEVFNSVSGTWTQTDALNNSRWNHTANLLADGSVLVVGGHENSGAGLASTETLVSSAPTVIVLTTPTRLGNGSFQFSFTSTPGASFTALAATNVSLPLNDWTVLGAASEVFPGLFQFTDSQASNNPCRFYRVRLP
jgi:hypothetical protein